MCSSDLIALGTDSAVAPHKDAAKELGLMVNRPSGADASQTGGSSVPIHVLANGEIWIDNRVIDLRAVRANVERMYATNPKNGVLIIADKDAETGLVVQVVDQIHLGGVYNITFSTTSFWTAVGYKKP